LKFGSTIYSGDTVTLTGTATGTYNSKDVTGNTPATTVTLGGLSLNNSNYTLTMQAPAAATITPKALSSTATIGGATMMVYNGSSVATGATVSGSVNGGIMNDIITLNTSGLSLSYNTAHVVGSSTINATGTTGFTIGSSAAGSLPSDYSFTRPTIAAVSGTITAVQLSATAAIAAASKIYDGTLEATGSTVSGSTKGAINGDTVTLNTSGLSLNFSDAHVVGSKTIGAAGNAAVGVVTSAGSGDKSGSSVGNLVVSLASDYALAAQPTLESVSGNIIAAQLTPTITSTNVTKVYDGTSVAPAGFVPTFSLSGLVSGDTAATLTQSGAAYNSVHVVNANQVTISGLAISGITGSGLASDYVLDASSKNVTATITQAPLTATIIGTPTKVYDGTTMATLAATNYSVSGFIAGEGASINLAAGTYSSMQVSTGNPIIAMLAANEYLPQGATVLNDYTLPLSASGMGGITAAASTAPLVQVVLPPVQPVILPPAAAPIQTVPSMPPTTQPVMAPPAAMPTQMPGSVVTQNTSSVATQDVGSKGISISVTRLPSEQQTGIVSVLVPKDMATAGSGFSFTLSAQVANTAAGSSAILVTTLSGQSLPSWLTFNPETRTFVAAAVPDGAFPMQVVVTVSGRSSTIVISEQAQ
jgi:trimeric autotransporter adhesin